jgi:hypothetical protein
VACACGQGTPLSPKHTGRVDAENSSQDGDENHRNGNDDDRKNETGGRETATEIESITEGQFFFHLRLPSLIKFVANVKKMKENFIPHPFDFALRNIPVRQDRPFAFH